MIDPRAVVAWVMLVGLLITAPLAAADGIPSHLGGSAGWLVLAGGGNVAGLIFIYFALRIGQVALVAPLASTEGAIAAVIALSAGESLAPSIGVTLAVVVVGIALSSVPGADRSLHESPGRHSRVVLYALLAAGTFGASLYATGRAGAEVPSSWVVLSARLIGVVVLVLPLGLSGLLRLTRPALPLVVISGICEVLGFYSYTAGARHGIAVAAVLSSQFASLAALAGYVVLHERLSRTQLVGVATVVVGVAVLSALRA
jgi:drug/metabolite transporter (DMT)-like permease